ncbi:MAG: hypothetical protein K2I73_06355, partial [Eubacterium sp.]|nr:hypothetical protein [Eubacterium sp.]
MAKMKKKGTGRNRKKEKDKGYYALYFIVAFDIIFYFAYMNLFELIFLKVYSPDYFVSSKYN